MPLVLISIRIVITLFEEHVVPLLKRNIVGSLFPPGCIGEGRVCTCHQILCFQGFSKESKGMADLEFSLWCLCTRCSETNLQSHS